MPASHSMSAFCHWLLNEPGSKAQPCAIVLQGDPAYVTDKLVAEIAQYLNEYDDEADGLWLNADSQLIEHIASDPSSRRLLGMSEPGSSGQASPEEFLSTLSTLAKRGHLVFRSPCEDGCELDHSCIFHAGIGGRAQVKGDCHIIINPSMMAVECIPQVVADVFLEWLHCDERRDRPGSGAR